MKKLLIAVAVLAVLFSVTPAQAQLQSQSGINVTVNVTQTETITLTQNGGSLTIDPTTGQSNSITFNAVWNIGPANSMRLYTYFSSATAALSTTGGNNVASSQITASIVSPEASVNGGVCNQAPGVGSGVIDGASCPAVDLARVGDSSLSNTGANNNGPQGGTNVTFSLTIPNFAAQRFAAGAYSGTLNAVVIAL